MKAKDLAELLLEYPDFDVKLFDWMKGLTLDITGIADIGHSEKVINLDFKEGYIMKLNKEDYIALENADKRIILQYKGDLNTRAMREELVVRLNTLFASYELENELRIGVKPDYVNRNAIELVGIGHFSEYFLMKILEDE